MKIVNMAYNRNIKNINNKNFYSFAFCYPPSNINPFLIKGGFKDIISYLKLDLRIPLVVHFVVFKEDKKSKFPMLLNMGNIRIRREKPNAHNWNRRYYNIVDITKSKILPLKELRRIPRKWIKELDDFMPKYNEKMLNLLKLNYMTKNKAMLLKNIKNELSIFDFNMDVNDWIR